MAIKSISKKPKSSKVEIDLTGPDGNAFVLIGLARKYAKQLLLDDDAIIKEMMLGDYKNLLQVFDKNFGEYVTLYK